MTLPAGVAFDYGQTKLFSGTTNCADEGPGVAHPQVSIGEVVRAAIGFPTQYKAREVQQGLVKP